MYVKGGIAMKRTSIYLTDKQLERLHSQANAEGVALAELVRRAVEAYLIWNDPTYAPHPPAHKERRSHPPHQTFYLKL
jgi:hypothetical protein